ncbi:integral membrane sensor signal transduction histidine kinase [Psychromonas sp. CNPT3]|uniref:XrtA/PEP-CTERM system histidine kinase PrsK n=1 Tax=Psychromonas sp. CNPT3 TaxID=314282 RepID=UPI00006E9CC3|nr:XrtA/PEP-CTERM system histidine kinase PrsK [Psychromonas sp. CNPT3]AGH80208.1 integral membrane sensor signal transduction histidine kinase [Psychromonas sp. CNPT3]
MLSLFSLSTASVYLSMGVELALLGGCLFYIPKKEIKYSLILMAVLSALWQYNFTSHPLHEHALIGHFQSFEILRYCGFLLVLLAMLSNAKRLTLSRYWTLSVAIVIVAISTLVIFNIKLPSTTLVSFNMYLYVKIMFCLLMIVVAEQLLRHLDACRIAKFITLLLLSQIIYDLILHCALLLNIINNNVFWQARSFIASMMTVLLTIGILVTPFEVHKNDQWQLSNSVIIFNFSIIFVALFLIIIALLSLVVHYLQLPWATLASILFYVLALLCIACLYCMQKFRRKVNIFLSKHIFKHAYDHHKQWLKLDALLGSQPQSMSSNDIALNAMLKLFECDSGGLWLQGKQFYSQRAQQKINIDQAQSSIKKDSQLISYMFQHHWIYQSSDQSVDADEQAKAYLPAWFVENKNSWLIVPLVYQDDLLGFIYLCKEYDISPLTWEDIDILQLTGKQIASYLAQQRNAEKLRQNEQFELFHQISAFAIHDIKNLVAQQSLMIKNADKFKDSPEFIDDMILTLSNSVQKMEQLLLKLRQDNKQKNSRVDMIALLENALKMNQHAKPTPILNLKCTHGFVRAEYDELLMVINHLLQNAFDATNENGTITITLSRQDSQFCINIEDSGCGMQQNFINELLFKPFSSTKNDQSMGLGAYQIREIIHQFEGEVLVQSKPNKGTTFSIYLPLDNLG